MHNNSLCVAYSLATVGLSIVYVWGRGRERERSRERGVAGVLTYMHTLQIPRA
jgi:hypothetical protein